MMAFAYSNWRGLAGRGETPLGEPLADAPSEFCRDPHSEGPRRIGLSQLIGS